MKIVAILFATLFVASFLFVGLTSSSPYSPWYDFNGNGEIDIFDIVDIAGRYGTTGTPINITELLLELQARIDELEVIVASHEECIVVTGSKLYNAPISYISGTGFVIDVSGSIPSGFTLVSVFATGRKTDLGGTTLDEPPLNLLPKVSGSNIEIRVWDVGGAEYDDWSSQRAHIDYNLFITK